MGARMQAEPVSILRPVVTYDDLARHIRSWHEGYIPFLAVIGGPGLGKSFAYEQSLNGTEHHLFKGRSSAFEIFKAVHDEPDWPAGAMGHEHATAQRVREGV